MQKVTIADVNSYDLGTIKDSLKKMFLDLGYPEKNPLGEIIEPGNTVFIKPNWVASRWRASCDHVDDLYSVITHPSLLEALADFVVFSSPEAIVLFGGLTRSGDLLMKPVVESLNRNVMPRWKNKIKVLFSQLKESDAAILGASALAWELGSEN